MYGDNHYPPAEQQTQLLNGGRLANVPTTTAALADQMETGGAKIEETLQRLNCKYQTLFFISSWCVIIGAVMSLVSSLLSLKVATFVNSFFLFIFGAVMMVLDIPGSPRWAGKYRQNVRRYARFLTRLTGKSLWLLYLGCMIAVSLWPNKKTSRPFLIFSSLAFSLFVATSSLIGLFISLRKSLRLERVRKTLASHFRGNAAEVYRKYAITDPAHGMQFEEFNRMCSDFTQGSLHFDIADLAIIYNAIDDHQKSAINEREFAEWMAGPITYL